jgi:archaellum component FlaG (FlaF/FlaG flagellin family)
MKALSGAVTALILVIASVIVALIVVGFAFGLFGAFGGQNAVTQVGTAYMTGGSGSYTITVVLNNPGSTNPVIQAVSINAVPVTVNGYSPSPTLNAATIQTVTISVNAPGLTLQPGATVNVQLSLSNGQVVQVAAVYQ